MVRAWYRVDIGEDSDPLMPDPPEFVPLEELSLRTGIICMKFNADNWATDLNYQSIKETRGYNYEDMCELSRELVPNFDQLLTNFATEHIHADEEIRFVLAGTGFFDVRDWDDRWIRLEVAKDDFLILPAGIYHRFVLDSKKYIKVKRLFSGTPCWTAFYRPQADDHPARQEYITHMSRLKRSTTTE